MGYAEPKLQAHAGGLSSTVDSQCALAEPGLTYVKLALAMQAIPASTLKKPGFGMAG